MPDGLPARLSSGTGTAPALVGAAIVPAESSNRAYAGVVTGGIPRWRVVRTRRVESGSAWSGNQLHGGGYAQQVSRAAYERRQERTQCRRGSRGDVPRQRSSVDRRCHQDGFQTGPSKASPEVVAHQAPLAPVARRGSAPCADDGDEDERNGPIRNGLAARKSRTRFHRFVADIPRCAQVRNRTDFRCRCAQRFLVR